MARYFFDFRQGVSFCADEAGAELAHVEQAYLEAFTAAQEMWGELLRKRQDPRRCAFEVRNEKRELLFVLPFQEVIDSCVDHKTRPLHNTFEEVAEVTHYTKRVITEFIDTLHSVRSTLEQSRALVRAKE